MKKLISILIPCYNEAETLEIALNDLPKHIDGIDEIEYLIDLAADLKAKKKQGILVDTFRGKNIALIF